jgi:LuxR family maltose regulon positive regulatory protein
MLQICAEKNELKGLLLQVKILNSIIFNILKNDDEAFKELSDAIDLSLNEKPLQVFLTEGNLMKDLLEKLKTRILTDSCDGKRFYVDKIITSFKPDSKNNLAKTAIALKAREIEVLNLIKEGASNSEIAEELFISINTVKTHILNVYSKLDVHSRTKAVAKAKELNLIE